MAVIINLDWPYKHHHEVFVGVERYAVRHGWECIVVPHPDARLAARGSERGYDGIIARTSHNLARRARRAGTALVNVGVGSPLAGQPISVLPDSRAAGQMEAKHFLARGFRNFAFLATPDRDGDLQRAGFQETVAAAGYACRDLVVPSHYSDSSANWRRFQNALGPWMAAWPLPIAVGVSDDVLARYLAEACRQCSLNVPHQVAIIGNSNEPVVCLHPEPTLSSVDMAMENVGRRAARLLDALMAGEDPPEAPTLVPPAELVVRQSTSMFAVSDRLVARALRFVAEHSHEPIQVGSVAAEAACTRRTLERRFREALGRSVAQEITRARLERVKRQLVETDTPIKLLAPAAGYRSAKRMCEVFRRVEGVSPGQFRRRHQTKYET